MKDLLKVAVIGGDGTGPEVTAEGVKVLKEVAKLENINLELTPFDLGGERYLKTGVIITDDEIEQLGKFSSILLGAVGHPDVKPGILEQGLLLRLRFAFDQYINLRPVKLFPGVEIIHGEYSTMQLRNITKDLNGWKVYCRYSNRAGYTDTAMATITVTDS